MSDGTADVRRAISELATRLPPALTPLAELAYNYWWSWAPDGEKLFAALDERGWELAAHDPIRLLHDTSTRTLERAASRPELVASIDDLAARLRTELEAPSAPGPSVAFFCM